MRGGSTTALNDRVVAMRACSGALREIPSKGKSPGSTRCTRKIVSLSVSLLLEAADPGGARRADGSGAPAFNALGNSELETEDVSQVPAFLSMLPGSGAYQLRKKGCTSRNAGDLLPCSRPGGGCSRAASVLSPPTERRLQVRPLRPRRSANAFHGLVAADTGSGKSVSLGALTTMRSPRGGANPRGQWRS